MLTLRDAAGAVIATVETRSLGGGLHGVVLTWAPTPHDLSLPQAAAQDFRHLLEQARVRGAQTLQARVVAGQADVDPAVVTARACWQRSLLTESGFMQGSGRVEFQTPLEQAIEACAGVADIRGLAWEPVASEPGPALERAAQVLRAAAIGDPDSDPDDDALGFLLARREQRDLLLTPECIQLGRLHGADAAIVAPSVKPGTGWCSLYYLAVVSAHRGCGLGRAAMVHGLRVMHRLGGRTYHDGTSSENHAALALLRRMGAQPYRSMEQWTVRL